MNFDNLPKGWRGKRVGEISEISYGKGLPKRKRSLAGSIPVYGSNGQVRVHDTPKTVGPTIIIGRKGSIGAVHFCDPACWPIDTTYFIEKFSKDILPIYLFLFLKSLDLASLDRSAAIPGIRREDLQQIDIPVPPLSEQRCIVARIEELTSRIEEAKGLRLTAQKETEAVMPAALANVFTGRNEWPAPHMVEDWIMPDYSGAAHHD